VYLVAVAACCGCTPAQYAEQADRAAYGMLAGGQRAALGEARAFDVSYQPFGSPPDAPGGVIRVAGRDIPVGEGPPAVLTLRDCLAVSFRNSRSFQDRKEALYSSALAVASSRRTWDFSLVEGDVLADAAYSKENKGAESGMIDGEAGLSLTQRFVHGGILTLAATLSLAADMFGGTDTTIGSLLEVNFTQPLLRGAWRGLAYEDQYRLERDFLFAVFEYERFTQTFAADIVSRYYSVLRQRDRLENDARSIRRLEEALALTKLRVEGGQVSPIQQDEAEQNLLDAKVSQQVNRQAYENLLDGFKVALGLPLAANVKLDYPAALGALAERTKQEGLAAVPFTEDQAVEVALAVRPDVLSRRARVRDAERDVEIAADAFLPQLDVELGIEVPGKGQRQFHKPRFHRHTRFANVVFAYPLDQTDNRDAYRAALIALAKARRDLEEFLDRDVRLGVREAYRSMVQSRQTYTIRRRSVEIADRRFKLALLEQREGLASARDVVSAEEALRDAQNGLTGALVSYTTTRIELLAELGMIAVDEKGAIHERREPAKFDRLRRRYPYVGG
jgi:outer membrane protein TolC